jgi:hypothetical protein
MYRYLVNKLLCFSLDNEDAIAIEKNIPNITKRIKILLKFNYFKFSKISRVIYKLNLYKRIKK